jgi:hypothetical protein
MLATFLCADHVIGYHRINARCRARLSIRGRFCGWIFVFAADMKARALFPKGLAMERGVLVWGSSWSRV